VPKIVDKKKKMKTISGAALRVFREVGYPNTRMADIAKSAGIGKGTLYEYFRDKADILRFAFDEYFNIFIEGVFEATIDKTEPSVKLVSLIDFALQHAAEWEDHCAIYVDYFGAARIDKGGQFSLSTIYGQMKRILIDLVSEAQLAGEIEKELDPAVVAELLVSVFDGIILHRVFEGQGADRESLRKATVSLIKNGLRIRTINDTEKSEA
jgi:TetR/AcrR family acrAB operon transcriptional repressor